VTAWPRDKCLQLLVRAFNATARMTGLSASASTSHHVVEIFHGCAGIGLKLGKAFRKRPAAQSMCGERTPRLRITVESVRSRCQA